MTRYCVTGGAGFIGSHLVDRLLAEDTTSEVRVVDDLSTGKAENLPKDVELLRTNVRHIHATGTALRGVDVVFHLAALGSVPRSLDDPVSTHEVNATGTLSVLMAARDAGVRRVVFASSSSVYGGQVGAFGTQVEGQELQPRSPYAASKLAGEGYCRAAAAAGWCECVVLRYFNVFGPRQDPDSPYAAVVPRFVRAALRGEEAVVYGNGLQSRDFTFVENVVQANVLAARADLNYYRPGARFFVANVATGQRTTIIDLLNGVELLTGCGLRRRFEAARPGDVRHSLADIAAARCVLGYEPAVTVAAGLRQTVEWFKAREEA